MLLFGHLGIGNGLTYPFLPPWRPESRKFFPWICVGTLLPDLIDKPLFHIPKILVRMGWIDPLPLISGTRTFGHTALLLLLICLFALWKRQKNGLALSLGIATHLLLDNLMDRWLGLSPSSAWSALVFPALGFEFAVAPFENVAGHFRAALDRPDLLIPEFVGLLLFVTQWRRFRRTHPRRR